MQKVTGMREEKSSKVNSVKLLNDTYESSGKKVEGQDFIKISVWPTLSQKKTMLSASRVVNARIEARGGKKLTLFTIRPPADMSAIYDHDKQILNIINSLMTELDMCKQLELSHEKFTNEQVKERDHWKKIACQAEIIKMKNERRIRDLEVEASKLKFTIDDIKQRKKAVEQRVREIRNEWETHRVQTIRDKLRADENREELMYRLKSKNHLNRITKENGKQKKKKTHVPKNNEMLLDMETERQKSKSELFMVLNFVENVYRCLEKMKASDGDSPIDKTFLVNTKNSYVEKNHHCGIPYLLTYLNEKVVGVLNEIKSNPFGSNDTFRSRRIGAEKQREISILKKQLDVLKESYDKIADTKQKEN